MLQRVLTLLFATSMATDIGSYVPVHPAVDNSTFANIDQIRVQHQFVDWYLTFDDQMLQGAIVFDMQVQQDLDFVVLDIWNLEVTNVLWQEAGAAGMATTNGGNIPVSDFSLEWEVKAPAPNPGTGTALVIKLPIYFGAGQEISLEVQYKTPMGGNAGANFLLPNQTHDGTDPFFFTYSYQIQGRMIAPQQDTPANRITYGACITAQSNLTVGMSANFTGAYSAFPGYQKNCFDSMVPMPNYMMAAVVGNLIQSQVINYGGIDTYIWAEPGQMSAALSEYSNLQQIFQTVGYYVNTPYVWGDFYRLVVMPPSYPMGGMANPLLSYVSPTTLTSDAALEYTVIRNIAQMWTGAQVTPDNWEDVWINEGFTTYIARMVTAQLETLEFTQTEAFVYNTSMSTMYGLYGVVNETYATMHPVLHGANPDYTISIVPAEKGFQLMWYIEQDILGYPAVQDFFTYYIEQNNLKSINAFKARKTMADYVQANVYPTDADAVNDALAMIDYAQWVYVNDVAPQGNFNFSNNQTMAAQQLAMDYIAANGTQNVSGYEDYNLWSTNQKVVFHQYLWWNLGFSGENPTAVMAQIDMDLDVTNSTNPEVRQRWYSLGIYMNYTAVYEPCGQWVTTMGRINYIAQVFEACSQAGLYQLNICKGWQATGNMFWVPLTQIVVADLIGWNNPIPVPQ